MWWFEERQSSCNSQRTSEVWCFLVDDQFLLATHQDRVLLTCCCAFIYVYSSIVLRLWFLWNRIKQDIAACVLCLVSSTVLVICLVWSLLMHEIRYVVCLWCEYVRVCSTYLVFTIRIDIILGLGELSWWSYNSYSYKCGLQLKPRTDEDKHNNSNKQLS